MSMFRLDNPSGAETRIVRVNKVNVMEADILALYITKSSWINLLPMYDKRILVFFEEGFQSPLSS